MIDNHDNEDHYMVHQVPSIKDDEVVYKGKVGTIVGYTSGKVLLKVDGKNIATNPKSVGLKIQITKL